MPGFMGRVLFVNLAKEKSYVKELPEDVYRCFIGGTGLAAYLIKDHPFGTLDPLGGDNPLVFSTGPLTGTSCPTSGRYAVAAKSPLTGIWGESDSGGRFGISLKAAGYDALVLEGTAPRPSVLLVEESGARLLPAGDLWGKDTYETAAELASKFGEKAASVCIGPAGEELIPLASIMSEGVHARAAGRCGLGAVMGAKRIKAVLATGNQRVGVAKPEELRASIRRITPQIVAKTKRQRELGTAGGVVGNAVLGDMCGHNWRDGDWGERAALIGGEAMAREYVTRRYHCPTCPIGCGKVARVTRGTYAGTESGAPEYETIAGFGAQCDVMDLAVVVEANDLCNRLGIDTISVSGAIAFLFEAVEKGFVKPSPTDPKCVWGNGEAIPILIHQIVHGEGVGGLIRNGVRNAAKMLGSACEAFAMHVKGLELPYHDPRALSSLSVAYATSARGACHRGCTHNLERFAIPGLGYREALDRFECSGKGEAVARVQNYAELYNCLKLCQFIMSGVDVPDLVGWLNAVTGWEMDTSEFLMIGERSINLKRLLNIQCGIRRPDDTIPRRILAEPFSSGGAAGHVPDFEPMLLEYYRARGWTEEGVPSPSKLSELGLEPIGGDKLDRCHQTASGWKLS